MNNTTNIIFISFLGLSLSSCAALERMEKERIEKEKQELAQMRSYNPSLVNFFEKEMKPLLKDKGQLAKSPRFDPNDPKLNLEKRFMEVSWGNRVSLLLNGHLFLPNFDKRKASTVDSILTLKYRNYIEKQGGTVKEGDIKKSVILTKDRQSFDKCKYSKPLYGYIKNNLDSVFVPFICIGDSGYGGERRSGEKQSIKITIIRFRVIDGVMAEKRFSGFLSGTESDTPTLSNSLSGIGDSAVKVKDSIVDLLLHPMK